MNTTQIDLEIAKLELKKQTTDKAIVETKEKVNSVNKLMFFIFLGFPLWPITIFILLFYCLPQIISLGKRLRQLKSEVTEMENSIATKRVEIATLRAMPS